MHPRLAKPDPPKGRRVDDSPARSSRSPPSDLAEVDPSGGERHRRSTLHPLTTATTPSRARSIACSNSPPSRVDGSKRVGTAINRHTEPSAIVDFTPNCAMCSRLPLLMRLLRPSCARRGRPFGTDTPKATASLADVKPIDKSDVRVRKLRRRSESKGTPRGSSRRGSPGRISHRLRPRPAVVHFRLIALHEDLVPLAR